MRAIHILRKPLAESTVVTNVLTHGCGALNIDATRITGEGASPSIARRASAGRACKVPGNPVSPTGWLNRTDLATYTAERVGESIGRWPANLVLQHLDGCVQTGVREDSVKRPAPEYNPAVHQGKRASLNGIGCSRGDAWYSKPTTVAVYECKDGCPVAALDAQNDGASRFFKQVS